MNAAAGVTAAAGVSEADLAAVTRQLGRPPRGVRAVAHRCPCGLPDVVETAPRLPDGTPFPTLYYLTCPRAAGQLGRLEAEGTMREMTTRLRADADLAARYAAAAQDYRQRRARAAAAADLVPLPDSAPLAGGMPERVKCLHALAAHALAVGTGVNPFGDEAVAALSSRGRPHTCLPGPGEGT